MSQLVKPATTAATIAMHARSTRNIFCPGLWVCLLVSLSTLCQAASPPEPPAAVSESSTGSLSVAPTGSLSVAPAGELRYPEQRPNWIDAGPSLEGEIHRWPVCSSPSSTPQLSRRALAVQIRAAAETYVETLLRAPEAPAAIALPDRWITDRLDPDRSYEGEIDAGDEVLYEAAAELRFDPESRAWIESQWQSHRVGRRMIRLGVIAFGGTLLLLMTTAGLSIALRRRERRMTTPVSV